MHPRRFESFDSCHLLIMFWFKAWNGSKSRFEFDIELELKLMNWNCLTDEKKSVLLIKIMQIKDS